MAIAGPSSEPVSLPLLPHPELFIRPSAFTTHILNEAIRGLRSLDQLKEDVVTGRFSEASFFVPERNRSLLTIAYQMLGWIPQNRQIYRDRP